MATMFLPDADRLRTLGFESVATVPVLFDNSGRYCREYNRYLRERALGETRVDSNDAWYESRIPLPKTIENVARHLGVFSDWCQYRKCDWREIGYKQGIISFQNDMASGRWSPSGRQLAATTVNQRADEVTKFLAWAADRRLRREFKVAYKVVNPHSGRTRSFGPEPVLVKSRLGRLPESDSEDVEKVSFLPQPDEVQAWLLAVRHKKGYPKYLASRWVLETGTRLFETVAIKENQLPGWERLKVLAEVGQTVAPVKLTATKGGRPRTISVPIAFLAEIRRWIDGRRLKLRYLWHRRTNSAASQRLFLSDARGHEGTPISKGRLYDCFRSVTPRPVKWHTHFGRHTYACFYMLYALEHEAKSAGRPLSEMGSDWIVARGNWYLNTLRKQLGHISDETTDLYLRWLMTASGLASAAVGWHNFLADGVDQEVMP